MGAPIVDDELWALIEPLLPTPKPRRKNYQWRSCQRDPDRRESQRRHPTAAAG
jgi:hypothetical protein